MANLRNGETRHIVIDRCLHNRRGYSTMEMFEKCNDVLEMRGEHLITALNTIRNDLLYIENRWNIHIESIRNGREIRYRYEDPKFSIFNSPLTENEILQLTQAVSLLRRFEGMPGFGWVEEMSAHIQKTVSANSEPIIGFNENKELKGISFFTPLFNSIISKKAIKIFYRSYKSNKNIEAIIHPYYLKEYNQRWFLFALNDQYHSISNFALDRIESIERTSTKYIPNTIIDFDSYFDDVVGVTVNPEEVQSIRIWLSKEQAPYTLSKPIHHSQETVEEHEDGSAVITIEVIPNFELMQLLLSFGERIKILSPESLKEDLLKKIKNIMEIYE